MPDAPKPLSLYAKLAQVMAEIGYVEKRGHNSFHGYKYVTEADLVDAVRSKLAARNIVVIPSLTGIDERAIKTAKGKDSTITTARIAFTFCDGDSGQTHTAEWAGAGDDPADKGLYKAMTGAAKYFLMKSFLIPTGDDPEADAGTDQRAAESAPPPPETIKDTEAKALYDEAQSAGIPDDKLLQAIAHVSQARASKLEDLTGPQALKLGAWIEKKGTEAKADA
jgi:hypothetical protein